LDSKHSLEALSPLCLRIFSPFGALGDASIGASPPFCCAQPPLLVLDEGGVLIGFWPFLPGINKEGTSPRCPLVNFFCGGMSE
jgi:hypothetical protein